MSCIGTGASAIAACSDRLDRGSQRTPRWREPNSNPRSPSTASSVHAGGCDATHAAIVKPRNASIVRGDALGERFAARLGMDKAELEIGFGDFEHLAASLFAFSARLEICRDDRIAGRVKAQIADESGIP